tara:strand:+ start:291 stop:665 length:375 start_codon:yes stop_codon:yes gene_type:complete
VESVSLCVGVGFDVPLTHSLPNHVFFKPFQKYIQNHVITMGNHGVRGGYPDFFTDGSVILTFIAGIGIVISPLYIVTYLKIRVMNGKISYEEKLLDLLLEQEFATFSYVPIVYIKHSDRSVWMN